jgi:hypothetical protein
VLITFQKLQKNGSWRKLRKKTPVVIETSFGSEIRVGEMPQASKNSTITFKREINNCPTTKGMNSLILALAWYQNNSSPPGQPY